MSTIVHITAPAGFGGLERVVSGIATATAAKGHKVVLIAVLEPQVTLPAWAAALCDAGVTVEPIHVAARAYCEERQRVLERLHKHGAEIVHTHGYRSDFIDGPFAQRAGYPVVSTAHGFIRTSLRGRLYNQLQIRALRRFDAVVAVSQPLFEQLRLAGVSPHRLVQINNGFVPATEPPLSRLAARERLGLPTDSKVIGWVGRVSHEKGPDVMLEALRMLTDHNAILCMVGDGPALENIRAAAAAHGVAGRLRLTGAVPNAQSVLQAFDALALSSRTEGLPMVLLEAASAGVPIVATAVGGVPAFLGSRGGLVVRPDDPHELAEAVDKVLSDPVGASERARRLSNQLQKTAAEENWIDRYESLYERLRTSSTSRPS